MDTMDLDAVRTLTRRRLLQLGGSGGLGLSLGGLLRAQSAQAGSQPPFQAKGYIKACILIFYYGGPSHLETFDPKPRAPSEVRGEYRTIATSVPGVRVCEHLPRTARLMNRLALVRGLHHPMRNHNSAAA